MIAIRFMSSLIYIFQGSGRRTQTVLTDMLRTALPYFFTMLWPFIVVNLFGKAYWGDCVDALLIINVITLITDWGSKKYLLKRFDLTPNELSEAWHESIYTRLLILICFLLLILISPFSSVMKTGICILITSRFIYATYEAIIKYKHRHLIAIVAELIGFLSGLIILLLLKVEISNEYIIFSMAIGEIVRNIILIIFIKDITFRIGLRYFQPTYLTQAYPFFMLAFTSSLIHVVDRVFVYTTFSNEIKSEYQIYMNFLLFMISLPNFLLMPYFKNYYKSKLILTRTNHSVLIVIGTILMPLSLWIIWFLCKCLYQFDVSNHFLFIGALFIFPSFIYYPFTIHLIARNKQLEIAFSTLIISAFLAFLCNYLIQIYGVTGALYTATTGQWLLMGFIVTLYILHLSEKKIKFIK